MGPEEELQPGRIYSSGVVEPVPISRISSLKTHELYPYVRSDGQDFVIILSSENGNSIKRNPTVARRACNLILCHWKYGLY